MPKARILCSFLAAALLIGLIFLFFSADTKVNQANLELIRSYGWEVEETPIEISHLTIPPEFDAVYQTYNALVQTAGFDMTPYMGVTATRYSYRVLNHKDSDSGNIRINVFVTKKGIAAADISNPLPGGFVLPINDTSGQIN